jgi:type I restriction enzyme M protein
MDKKQFFTTSDLARVLGISRQAALKLMDKLKKEGREVVELGKSLAIASDKLPDDLQERIRSEQKEAAGSAIAGSAGKNSFDIERFKKELWSAADKLRGNIDASEYKGVVLGLLFLKYVSDSYYQRRAELEIKLANPDEKEFFIPNVESRKSILEDKNQYRSVGGFYIPQDARWETLQAHALQDDIGQIIDAAMQSIEEENLKQLQGVLPKIYTNIQLEPHVLGELVNIFSRISFDHDGEKEKDILGRVYEYFLSEFASAEGKRGGEFYTPRSLVRLIVEILEPYENSRVFDPAAGSGGMFVQSSAFLKDHHKDPTRIAIFGQESNPNTLKLCKMNLAIRGIFGQVELGNSYYDDKFPELRADFVIANPPFNADWDPDRLSEGDPRIKYGKPPGSNANFLWIQHFIHHLSASGMAGFVMANGSLAVSGREGEIRKKIIEADLVDVIIACPPKLFASVTLPVSLWFISNDKKGDKFRDRSGETLFIDARETFTQVSRKQVTFTDEQIQKIANTVRAWRGEDDAGEYRNIAGFCKSATLAEIEKDGFVLTPGRYVGVADDIDDGVPFEEKVAKLTKELEGYFEQSEEIKEKIKENLKRVKL